MHSTLTLQTDRQTTYDSNTSPTPTFEVYERRGNAYVFMRSKIHSRRLTGPQPAIT